MTVSIEQYRIKIGCFQPKYSKQPKLQKRNYVDNETISWLYILIFVHLVSPTEPILQKSIKVIHPSYAKIYSSQDGSTCSTIHRGAPTVTWQQGLQGFASNKTNQVCQIKNGNKKKSGYIISSWNCGRGLMTKNSIQTDKMIDIKLFIEEEKNQVSLE